MANYVSGVNPRILKWAREKAGYSLDDVAISLKKDVEEITQWETGQSLPTYNQLERLAYTLYKRPIAIFFFPEPPDEPDPHESFRTLPESEIATFLPDTHHTIRRALGMQMVLYELTEGKNPSERMIFRDIHLSPGSDVVAAATEVRDYLGITVNEQFSWTGKREALETWRDAIQDCGVFVFKRAFKQKDVSGFCLMDGEFPIIYLNNSTSLSRQIFSLFHELAHLLLSTSGVTKVDDRFIPTLARESRDIEVFCNAFAAELLVPSRDLDARLKSNQPVEQLVDELSNTYGVSREVILRKLLDRNLVDQAYYERKAAEWIADFQRWRSASSGGGNYYATQAAYLGSRFLNLAFTRYYEGSCSLQQLADYLSIKTKSVAGLEQYVLARAPLQ